MPAKKGTSKGASKGAASKKSASKAKASGGGSSSATTGYGGIQPLYGVVIREAIARGDAAEMKRLSSTARKHIQDVQTALAKLDAKIK